MSKIGLGGLSALLVLFSLAGCSENNQSQIVNITGPTPVTGGDGGGGGTSPPPPTTPTGSAPGAFQLDERSALCTPINDQRQRASFSWTASTGATSYFIYQKVWSLGEWRVIGTITSQRYEVEVDTNGDFYYRVIAKNASGETIASPIELFVCGAKPGSGDGGSGGGGGTTPPPTTPPTTPPPPQPPVTPKPVVDFTATPSNIEVGHASLLRWSVQNATSPCLKGGGWSGSVGSLGSQSVSPASTTTYTLSCTGTGGTTTASVTVNVTAPPPSVRTITLSPTSGSGKAGTTQQIDAVCMVGGVPTSCSPWWSSSDPSRVGVGSTNGLVSYIWNGTADICVQWSRTDVSPRACGTFTTVP